MSKIANQAVSDKAENNQQECIVVTKQGEMFRFSDKSQIHIVPDAIQSTITEKNLDKKTWSGRMKCKEDEAWQKMCQVAQDRTKRPGRSNGPREINRTYELRWDTNKVASIKTPQMRECITLVNEAVDKDKKVTEAILKEHVVKEAARLKTRQDPWRIFQYYRPQLVKLGVLKHD